MASVLKGLSEISLLITFILFIYWINTQRPARTPFKPLRLRAWIPALTGAMIFCWVLAMLNFPAMIQRTPTEVTSAHLRAQTECLKHLNAEHFLEASDAIRNRPPSHTLGPKGDYRGPILFGFLNPIINRILFGTGVAASSFPVLVWMAFIAAQRFLARRSSGSSTYTPSHSEAAQWGILLPIINNVTYLSAAVTLCFYFYVDPARSQKCIYSSGHWYTYTCTNLTLALVISHLWVYRLQSVYAARLLAGYIGYTIIYQAFAIAVLKNTQMYYHSAPEAQDGIISAIPVYICLMIGLLIIQYVTFLVTEHPQNRTNKKISTAGWDKDEQQHKTPTKRKSTRKSIQTDGDTDVPVAPSPLRSGPAANTRAERKRRESEDILNAPAVVPPTAPQFDDIPTAPIPSPPSAPSLTSPPAANTRKASSGDAHGDLMSQIAGGGNKLKKVTKDTSSTPAPAPKGDVHSDLMAQIASNSKKLRHVEGTVNTTNDKPQDGLAGMLGKIRMAVQPEVEDEEEDDGWEHVSKDE